MNNKKPSIAIVGASFAGLSAYLVLKKNLKNEASITIIDFRKKFTYTPGLHETLGNQDRLKSLQFDIKKSYKEDFLCKKVSTIEEGCITFEDKTQECYDYIVIATGSSPNYFGNESLEKFTHVVRHPEDIGPINKILTTAKTVNVIGGGFTGVEVASSIADHYKNMHVRLIHGRERCFNNYDDAVSQHVHSRLLSRNVELVLNERVTQATPDGINTKSGKQYDADLTIRATGVKLNDQHHASSLSFESEYSSKESKKVYICGDVFKNGVLATAHNAMIEGRRVGHLIADKIHGLQQNYKPVENRTKLAIALGKYDGVLTNEKQGIYVPKLVGFAKRIIEKRVLFEFKHRILLRL